jgi:uncharacterized protein with PIN domain
MGSPDNDVIKCPQCGSIMWSEDDHVNMVRVLVCTRPTCLYRIYPDYPKRKGNQEICYLCETIFTAEPDDLGMLCPQCKRSVKQYQRKISSSHNVLYNPRRSKNIFHI